ncbi:MAG TPA: AAA family ATPase [Mycobacterium sp.]|nr:AAA family ATPase [Mycobacterium sp.]
MPGMASRPSDEKAVCELLESASSAPSALLIDGEPGIGKTTLWSAALEYARDHAFRVLSARVASAESVQAYTALADLLGDVEPLTWADLPEPQRLAIDQVLLHERAAGSATDQRAVSAAFLSVVEHLARAGT